MTKKKQHCEDNTLKKTSTTEEGQKEEKNSLETLENINKSLEDKVKIMEEKVKSADDKFLRSHAEMENIRRRAQKDISDTRKFALNKFVKSLLPVIDSLEKASEISSKSEIPTSIHEGIDLTIKMFVDTLETFGVKKIAPNTKEEFNPERHEAMAMQENAQMKNNQIMEVFQNGYEINGRVIRAAKVLVVKN